MIRSGAPVQRTPPTAYEMGVDFIARDDLPDTIPAMRVSVDGWSVYSHAEGDSPEFEGFFVDRAAAWKALEERDHEGEKADLFDRGHRKLDA